MDEMSWAGLMVVLMQASSPPQSENDTPVAVSQAVPGTLTPVSSVSYIRARLPSPRCRVCAGILSIPRDVAGPGGCHDIMRHLHPTERKRKQLAANPWPIERLKSKVS